MPPFASDREAGPQQLSCSTVHPQKGSSEESMRSRFPRMFRSDPEFGESPLPTFVRNVWLKHSAFFHDFQIEGVSNLPESGAALIVGIHTTHNHDIPMACAHAYKAKGRVVRAMLHRAILSMPGATNILQRLGGAPGSRELAIELLKDGHLVACLPGALEETQLHMTRNGRHAYEVLWENSRGKPRTGFASVAIAMGPGFKVIPFFIENGEEMFFNFFQNLWTFLYLDTLYSWVMRAAPEWLFNIMYLLAMQTWVATTFLFPVPVPVKAIAHIGQPVVVKAGETEVQFQERVKSSVNSLIEEKLGGRRHRSYWGGIRLRFANRKRD